ncbi:regulatory helix-turn-helix protein, lysR family [Bradyrhizobium sp. Rc2d]|uniref:LysR family transcriptional regulator n=1 Tax=Bradyrhizobium sp. Rc2d TaxID=1855321 RepID=UPI000888F07C|nr:regulatory helix-turn-helix protein, lysR family [Bradyrhizobium sp. Rc2d]
MVFQIWGALSDRLEGRSILVASAEAGSLSAADRRLGVPLTTISRKVADLKAHLNTKLLVRSARKLSLIEAGLADVSACKRIPGQVDEGSRRPPGVHRPARDAGGDGVDQVLFQQRQTRLLGQVNRPRQIEAPPLSIWHRFDSRR